MSEIRDKVVTELRAAGFGEGQISYALGMREIAVVDRDAVPPNPKTLDFYLSSGVLMASQAGIALERNLSSTYSEAQQDMLAEGWVKEVRA